MWTKIDKLWKSIHKGVSSFTWKGILSLLVGIVGGIIIGSYVVYNSFSTNGCVVLETDSYIAVGFIGLLLGALGTMLISFFMRCILQIPVSIREGRSYREQRKKDKKLRRKELGLKYISQDIAAAIGTWALIILIALITIISISAICGYVWWILFC